MLTNKQKEMFAALAQGQPLLREYLSDQLAEQHTALEKAVDEAMLRRAQGHAACLRSLIALLTPSTPKGRG